MIPLVAFGCVLSSGCDGGDEPADTDNSATSGMAGPNIVEVAASATAVGEGGFVELTVVVTHADMLDELVGGLVRLQDDVLGPLVQVSNGVYSFGVAFADLSAASGGTAVLEIELLDNSGMVASTTIELNVCNTGSAVCTPGMCTDVLMSDANCGACGNACDANEECTDGFCQYTYDPGGSDSGYYGADFDDYDDILASDPSTSMLPIPTGKAKTPFLEAFNL